MFKITDSAKTIIEGALKENSLDVLKIEMVKHGDHFHPALDLIKKEDANDPFEVNGILVSTSEESLTQISSLTLDADEEGLILRSQNHHCCHHDHEDSEEHDCCCHHEENEESECCCHHDENEENHECSCHHDDK